MLAYGKTAPAERGRKRRETILAVILKFFAWLVWGVVSSIIFVGLMVSIMIEGLSSVGPILADPVSLAIMAAAYVPGGVLFLLGKLVERMGRDDGTQKHPDTPTRPENNGE